MKNVLVALAMILGATPASIASAEDEEPSSPVIEMWNHVHEVCCRGTRTCGGIIAGHHRSYPDRLFQPR